jgi:hypothetical protein
MAFNGAYSARAVRKSCGSVTVGGLQVAALVVVLAFVLTLVVLGNSVLVSAGAAVVLLAVALGKPLPRLTRSPVGAGA